MGGCFFATRVAAQGVDGESADVGERQDATCDVGERQDATDEEAGDEERQDAADKGAGAEDPTASASDAGGGQAEMTPVAAGSSGGGRDVERSQAAERSADPCSAGGGQASMGGGCEAPGDQAGGTRQARTDHSLEDAAGISACATQSEPDYEGKPRDDVRDGTALEALSPRNRAAAYLD